MKRLILLSLSVIFFASCGGGATETATENIIPELTSIEGKPISEFKQVNTDYGKRYYYNSESIYDSKGNQIYKLLGAEKFGYKVIDKYSEGSKIVFVFIQQEEVICSSIYETGNHFLLVIDQETDKEIITIAGFEKVKVTEQGLNVVVAGCNIKLTIEEVCNITTLEDLYKEKGCEPSREEKFSTIESTSRYINNTVWTHTLVGSGVWMKFVFSDGRVAVYSAFPRNGEWGEPQIYSYEIDEGRYSDTGERYVSVTINPGDMGALILIPKTGAVSYLRGGIAYYVEPKDYQWE